ncbi:MAG: aromatic acid exporter family protein [Nocardioidaceae bacterium]|nr:aromatic acid exporter family protein [Nocardioidaceae bacterium]NUS50586.1 aromatic acid exporter family protein [Nocardioidaceae bacterium]
MWDRGRVSFAQRRARLRSKAWAVGQCAVAAGVAWWLAHDVVGHPQPFFAPIVAVICLGTSYGQRLRRVAEVTVGVAVGVFLADLLLQLIGTGAWQISAVVALAMSTALLLNAGPLFVNQAAVQGIVVITLVATPGYAFTRWLDAVIGGAVALVAATLVPRAPLRRPREQAAVVVRRIARLLRAAAESADDGDVERSLAVLADARSTDQVIRELQDAADEGLSVIASSPFRRRHTGHVRQMSELVEPLDRAIRNTRVLVRRVAVSAYHHERVPHAYAVLCADLADAVDLMADELASGRMADAPEVRRALLRVGEGTALVERVADLSADVVLAQIRSIVVDLLQITGMDVLEATDALPPPRQ